MNVNRVEKNGSGYKGTKNRAHNGDKDISFVRLGKVGSPLYNAAFIDKDSNAHTADGTSHTAEENREGAVNFVMIAMKMKRPDAEAYVRKMMGKNDAKSTASGKKQGRAVESDDDSSSDSDAGSDAGSVASDRSRKNKTGASSPPSGKKTGRK